MYVTAKGVQLALSGATTNWMPNHSRAATVTGTAGNDIFYAVAGDTMIGGAGDDIYEIWSPNYKITELAKGGNDTLHSYSWGVTTLSDNVENLVLMGSESTTGVGNALGNIIIAGSVGAVLDGLGGDDVLVGGAGKDTFQVTAGNGSDAIEKFTSGSDVIRLQKFAVTGFADLIAHGTQVGSDVRFSFSNDETLMLRGVKLGDLKATDFALPIDLSKYKMSFGDEFNSLTLKSKGGMWTPAYNFGTNSPSNHGFATESEVYVDPSYAGSGKTALGLNPFSTTDGVLSITATPMLAQNAAVLGNKAYTSGVISTQGSFSQQYGYFEIRAALPQGSGFWPAFWLLPNNLKGGELDVMESLGGDAGNIYLTSHTLVNGVDTSTTDNFRVFDPTAMHTYGLDWTRTTLTYYIDGVAVATQKTPDLLNQNGEMYMNINLATGGWAGATTGATASFKIDYVHVFANDDTTSRTVNGVQQILHGASSAIGAVNGVGVTEVVPTVPDKPVAAAPDVPVQTTPTPTPTPGSGDDVYVVTSTSDVVVEAANAGTDTVRSAITYKLGANVENLTLTGTAGIAAIGNELANVLVGNDGVNTLNGGAGADTMSGGKGDDTYIVDNAGDVVNESVGGGQDTVITSVSYKLAAGQEVETLRLVSSAAAVPLTFQAQNAGAAYSTSTVNGVTRFEVHAGDVAGNDGVIKERSELAANEKLVAGQAYEIGFKVMVEPGEKNTADWMTLLQLAATPDANEAAHSPPFALELVGDKMRIVTRDSSVALSTPDTINTKVQYTDATDIVRGQWYDFKIDVTFDASGAGTLTVTRDGVTLVNYTGAIGFNDLVGAYLKEGAYRDASSETIAADFKDLTLATLGDATPQNLNLTGNEFANTLIGNDGSNILDGGTGIDTLIGGKGNDTYIVDNAADVVKELAGGGTDTVRTSVSYSLAFGQDIENLQALDPAGTAALTLGGNELDNTITGNAGANVLDGGTGNDTMIGGAGDDTYIVDSAGDVTIEAAGGGKDTVVAKVSYALAAGQEIETLQLGSVTGAQNLNLTGNEFANALIGNAGNNVLDGGAGIDSMAGGLGDDTYIVDNAGDVVKEAAGAGNDTVRTTVSYTLAYGQEVENLQAFDPNGTAALTLAGNNLDNTITGNAGANTLDGGSGDDRLIGGAGDDTYVVDSAKDVVIEGIGGGDDTVVAKVSYALAAGQEIETLQLGSATGSQALNLTGNEFANMLLGNAGSNVLDGGAGADVMIGGLGDDTYMVDNVRDVVTEAAGGGYDKVIASVSYTLAAGQEIETLRLAAGTQALNLTGNEFANMLVGNAGNNTLDGGAGADAMAGGLGDDTYMVDNAGDTVTEVPGGGYDRVFSTVSYSLAAGQEVEALRLAPASGTQNLNLTGNEFVNMLVGNAGNNILDGGAGADVMVGGLGDDTYQVDNAGDVVTEAVGGGYDRIFASTSYTLGAGQEIEMLRLAPAAGTQALNLTGNELNNMLLGNAGSNILNGGAGNDVLDGAAGDDILIGGKGVDTMTGGAGNDTFRFDAGDFGSASAGWDVITDFRQGDRIDLSNAAGMNTGGARFNFIGTAGFTGHAGEVDMFEKDGFTWVAIDSNGDKTADAMIKLTGHQVLTSRDFVF